MHRFKEPDALRAREGTVYHNPYHKIHIKRQDEYHNSQKSRALSAPSYPITFPQHTVRFLAIQLQQKSSKPNAQLNCTSTTTLSPYPGVYA